MVVYGAMVCNWESGTVTTEGCVNPDTGIVQAPFVDTDQLGDLEDIEFQGDSGEIFIICTTCRDRLIMSDGKCSNPECSIVIDQTSLFDGSDRMEE